MRQQRSGLRARRMMPMTEAGLIISTHVRDNLVALFAFLPPMSCNLGLSRHLQVLCVRESTHLACRVSEQHQHITSEMAPVSPPTTGGISARPGLQHRVAPLQSTALRFLLRYTVSFAPPYSLPWAAARAGQQTPGWTRCQPLRSAARWRS